MFKTNVISVEELEEYVLVGYVVNSDSYSYEKYTYEEFSKLDVETLFIEPGNKAVLCDLEAENIYLAVDALDDNDKLCIVKDDDIVYYEDCLVALEKDCTEHPEFSSCIEEVNDNMLFIYKDIVSHIAFNTVDFSIYLGSN